MNKPFPRSNWVHVATLTKWNRPPVGIVRVEQEYCRWLLDQNDEAITGGAVRFCVYDGPARRFVEVPAERVRAQLSVAAQASSHTASPDQEVRGTGYKQALKNRLRPWLAYVPPELIHPLRRLAGQAYRIAQQWAYRLRHLRARLSVARAQPAVPVSLAPEAPFQPGDGWISLGLDWDTLDGVELYRVKQRSGLRITRICYDVIPVLFPQVAVLTRESFAAYLADLGWCADAVLCISEHTRVDFEKVLRQLGAPVPPTQVIRLGSEVGAQAGQGGGGAPALASLAQKLGDRPYVLFVSTLERRKNHEILYRAWTRLRDQGCTPHRLVFVGMPGWGVNDLLNDIRLDPRTQDDIVILNHVGDSELAWLYRQAAFTVFPSLYEGWGLPVVESLAWGKFCLCSNAASIPEAGGPWCEYLDPWDLPGWTNRLDWLMHNPQEVQARNARIAREFQPTTWAQTAAAIHNTVMHAATTTALPVAVAAIAP